MRTFTNRLRFVKIIVLSALFILVISCREDAKKESAEKPATTVTTPPTQTKSNTPASTQAIAKNPAHGQPGHRCDIPIGAPLNSPPANTNSGSPVITNSGSPVINSGNANPKVNPPHGQPGHRCDVKVGDPL